MSFVLISLFTLHVLFGCLIPSTVTLFIFSFCCTLYWFLQVYCIYCKRGHWWWSLTGLILFTLCVCVCLKSVKDSSRCKRREEQECFRLANCRSCSLNVNCQWELQQQECQALPGEETHAIMKAHTAVARNIRMFSYLKFVYLNQIAQHEPGNGLIRQAWGPWERKKSVGYEYLPFCFAILFLVTLKRRTFCDLTRVVWFPSCFLRQI